VLAVGLAGCSDAGTRLAYDIEAGVKRLSAADGSTIAIEHTPKSWPSGCSGEYDLEIEKGSAFGDGSGNFRLAPDAGGLTVRCEGGGGSTTYHLRFVEVPQALRVHKNAGEPTVLEFRRERGKALLVALR
jgi:hypothetical protein